MNLNFIFSIILSVIFTASPLLSISMETDHMETTQDCCAGEHSETDSKKKDKTCHGDDADSKKECRDKCKDDCNDHVCHVLIQTLQIPENYSESACTKVPADQEENSAVQDLTLQQIIYSFWNPPKQV